MSPLRWLAARGTVFVLAAAVPAAVVIALYSEGVRAVSFLYGVGVGLGVFASIAAAVALILNQESARNMALGAGIYVGRLVVAASAMAVPIALELLVIVPMVGGFVGVYAVENVVLLQGARKLKGVSGAQES